MPAPLNDTIFTLCGGFALALALGKGGGALAARARLPAVAGELAAGLLIAATASWLPGAAALLRSPETGLLAQLGLLLLLFEVGLHATVGDLLKVSGRAVAIALAGVAASLALGAGVAALLLPDAGPGAWLFAGAAIAATSVAVSARALAGRGGAALTLVLAASVIDDVIGLVLLTAMTAAFAAGSSASATGPVLLAALKAVGFLGAALILGTAFSRRLFAAFARLKGEGLLLAAALVLCFGFAMGALAAGLAPILGAFAAGLILEPAHSALFTARGERSLEDLLHPLSAAFAPVFFVQFGASMRIERLLTREVLLWGTLLTTAALLGKLACSAAVRRRDADRWLVSFAMMPRGEVTLVYAASAAGAAGQAALLPEAAVGGLVFMVLATTLLAPPLLAWRLRGVKSGT